MPTTDGFCPSCRQPFRDRNEVAPHSDLSIPPVVLGGDPFGDVGRVAHADNPYQSPAWSPVKEYAASPSSGQGLIWLLFSFRGRIARRHFWSVNLLATLAYYAVLIGIATVVSDEDVVAIAALPVIFLLCWVSLAAQVKRWHDRDKSGWWCFIQVVPMIGPLWVFIEVGCLRGSYGPNYYGPDPT